MRKAIWWRWRYSRIGKPGKHDSVFGRNTHLIFFCSSKAVKVWAKGKVVEATKNTNLPEGKGRLMEKVTGLIFQISPDAILFEFPLEEAADHIQIGIVQPSRVRVGHRNIPAEVKTKVTLGRYIKVGDELECRVVKEEGTATVRVEEEDEKGAMVEVEIQPDWRAR